MRINHIRSFLNCYFCNFDKRHVYSARLRKQSQIVVFFLLFSTILGFSTGLSRAQTHDDFNSLHDQIEKLDNDGKYEEAIAPARKAITFAENLYGKNAIETAYALFELGHLLRRISSYDEALPVLLRAQELYESKDETREGRDITNVYINLGLVFVGKLKLEKAEGTFKKSISVIEKVIGPKSVDMAYAYDGLARTYTYLSRFNDAIFYAEKSLQIKIEKLSSTSNEIRNTKSLIAIAAFRLGDKNKAEEHFKAILDFETSRVNPDEMTVADTLGLLAIVASDKGDFVKAEAYVRRSLSIFDKLGITDRGSYISCLNLMATILAQTQRFKEGEDFANRVLSLEGKLQSVQQREIIQANNSLSLVYMGQHRYADAEEVLKKALRIAEDTFGEDSIDVSQILDNLAFFYSSVGRASEALQLFNRISRIRENLLPASHPLIGSILANRVFALNKLKRYAEAETDARKAIEIFQSNYGNSYPFILTMLNELAAAQKEQGHFTEAESTLETGIVRAKTTEGEDSFRIPYYVQHRALVQESAGKYQEAEKSFIEAIDRSRAESIEQAQTRYTLGNFYKKRSQWSQARKQYAIATSVFAKAFSLTIDGRREYEGGVWLSEAASAYINTLLDSRDLVEGDGDHDAKEAFEIGQWLMRTRASQALLQLGSRYSSGNTELTVLVRKRQDLLQQWLDIRRNLDATIAQPISARFKDRTQADQTKLDSVIVELSNLDKIIRQKFPKYAIAANPAPIPVDETKDLLRENEVLVQFLTLGKRVLAWLIEPNGHIFWHVVPMTSNEINQSVSELRCGLDTDRLLASSSPCSAIYRASFTRRDLEAGKLPPFDAARANQLYNALLGPIASRLEGKQILIVPSGGLMQLPFHVLLKSLPANVSASGSISRNVAYLAANLKEYEGSRGSSAPSSEGVEIVDVVRDGAAAAAGLRSGDVLLSMDEKQLSGVTQTVDFVRSKQPLSTVVFMVRRGEERFQLAVKLGSLSLNEWRPHFMSDAERRSASWLARSNAVSVLPSASSLRILRKYAGTSAARDLYIGFGNPLLNGEPLRFADDTSRAALARDKRCGNSSARLLRALFSLVGIQRPLLRGTSSTLDPAALRLLPPLPETADELCDVARELGVDQQSHVYIGADATEESIKKLSRDGSLASRQIVHFATHGLVAGEMVSNAEPGLILTPPQQATSEDDGYLSAAEIATLRFDADWVILSACNTAAGEGANAEALSGLARAFFYAGARSLLVSYWSVASDSTVILITTAVKSLVKDHGLGRAEAMRRSILSLIAQGSDRETHPAVWAPFVVVGEGGAAR